MAKPVTPVSSVPEFCAVLGRSKLVSESDLMGIRQKWLATPKRSDADVAGFRKFLVQQKILTEYQAALIQRGRAGGFLIGEYTILDRIGSGQTAGVYRAKHQSGQLVALKVLAPSKASDPHLLNRFQREGRLLTQLDHPNAVRAYQVGQAGNVHFIVMEHLEGETLDEVIGRRKRFPAPEATRLVWQAFQGLQHLHDKRMLHRDLKPANLMLVPAARPDTLACTVKILDIGLGRELFDESSPTAPDLNLTGEGALLGTPDYQAPEQARDARTTDIRGDIYSLGCVLYHLLTGRTPFTEKNVMAQVAKHATEAAKPVRELVPEVPKGLSDAVDLLLKKKPDDRPQTPNEAAELLKPFLPTSAAKAESSQVIPAYREWLETESALEQPKEVKAARPVAKPSAAVPQAVARPAAVPATAVPSAVPPTAPVWSPPADEINVELVDLPDAEEDDRGWLELDRRDWIMLGAGGFLMLAAIAGGFGLTRLTQGKTDDEK